ncbi:hypothetical protein [Actinomadura decatromicini]|uniref:DUF4386 domain-containing protein n=1 Tax=Actinomadura decatromicini TaxID=2604572 RepID=A0A5D3FFL9_9ACTN|nr:hypothetical protein [Actinomadura decatromicini]TYK46758.1 hypothetical protein FXF68_23205 [Actinomadura decatromicini]
MNDIVARRFTAIAGIAFSAALIVEVPLYFVYSDEPPQSNVLTRLLFGILGLGFLLVFVSGLRDLIKKVNPECEWIANLLSTAGLAYVAVTLVSSGLEAGAVIASDKPIDPTITVTGTYILYGTIGRMLLAMFLGATAYAIARTRLLPSWTSKGSYVLAGINLAFIPSLFFGNTPAHFYAANGWGTTAMMGAILSYWLLAVSIALLRSARTR